MSANGRGLDRPTRAGSSQTLTSRDQYPTYHQVPGEQVDDPTYYDLPVLKKPVWEAAVPLYFYFGGVAGAAGALAAVGQLWGASPSLVKKLRWLNLVGTGIGSALLIEDLGRPERFLNMLRVFRPSSPMSVGSWALAFNGLTNSAAILLDRGPAWTRWLASVSGLKAGLFAALQCAYPGVLVACTTVPIWQQSRRSLPPLFVASCMASLGSLAPWLGLVDPAIERFGTAGKVAELVAMRSVEKESSKVERVGRPWNQGKSGRMWRWAGSMTAASLVLGLLPGKALWKKRLAGLLGTAGAVTMRLAVLEAGKASSQDPRASFHSQR
ncbi:MAG: polysulfide reductase NrfD [Candidatus Eremiobacteraeota bacterium]|nr:polysulfide reductase NrfD [Candidatus Eremiobacteraeota bacterium]